MASFSAFLEVGGSTYPLTYYDLYIHQYADSLGRPASPTLGGTITVELHSPGQSDTVLTEWMLSPTRQYDGFVHLYRDDTKAKLKTISFFNAYLIDMGEHFSASGSGPMKTQLVISPQRVAVGGIVHDNNWPEASHGAGISYAQPASYQEPQPKPKSKTGVITTPPPVGLPRVPKLPPAPPPGTPPTMPRLPQIPRNLPKLPPLPHPVLVFLAALFGWHDAGVANEWEQQLPEKDEQRYRELEGKRSAEIAKGGKLSPQEEEEFQALDKRKYPYGRGGTGGRTRPDSGESRQDLIDELRDKGTKFDEDKIIGIAKDENGKIVFLEEGNSKAGLQHIMRHANEFNAKGIADEDIADVVVNAAADGKKVGMQGTRPVYAVVHKGKTVYIAVTVSSNGFIVGANPTSKP